MGLSSSPNPPGGGRGDTTELLFLKEQGPEGPCRDTFSSVRWHHRVLFLETRSEDRAGYSSSRLGIINYKKFSSR